MSLGALPAEFGRFRASDSLLTSEHKVKFKPLTDLISFKTVKKSGYCAKSPGTLNIRTCKNYLDVDDGSKVYCGNLCKEFWDSKTRLEQYNTALWIGDDLLTPLMRNKGVEGFPKSEITLPGSGVYNNSKYTSYVYPKNNIESYNRFFIEVEEKLNNEILFKNEKIVMIHSVSVVYGKDSHDRLIDKLLELGWTHYESNNSSYRKGTTVSEIKLIRMIPIFDIVEDVEKVCREHPGNDDIRTCVFHPQHESGPKVDCSNLCKSLWVGMSRREQFLYVWTDIEKYTNRINMEYKFNSIFKSAKSIRSYDTSPDERRNVVYQWLKSNFDSGPGVLSYNIYDSDNDVTYDGDYIIKGRRLDNDFSDL